MKKEKVCINKNIKTILKKVEIKEDVLIPDIKPDIVNVISTSENVYISKETIEDRRVKVDGALESVIIYLSDDAENRSVKANLSFSEVIEDERIRQESIISLKTMISTVDVKILNERKIEVSACLILKLEIYKDEEIEILTSLEEKNYEKQDRKINIKNIISRGRVNNSLKEIIKTEDEFKILEIFKVDIEIKNNETKMSFNKVLAKAEVVIKVLYIDENKNIKVLENTFPLMTFIDIEKTTENYNIELDYIVRNIFFKIQNEGSQIDFQIDFEINNVLYEVKELNVIEDVYSLEKELEINKTDLDISIVELNSDENNIIKIDESFKIKDLFELLDYKIRIVSDKNKDIQKNMECQTEVNLLYLSNNKNIKEEKIIIPFIYKGEDVLNDFSFEIKEKSITMHGENINISLDIKISKASSSRINTSIIDSILEKDDIVKDDYNFIVYYIKENDTLWNIAKKFNTTVCNLKEFNEITDEKNLQIGEKIYIVR